MSETDQAPIEGLPVGMGTWGIGATASGDFGLQDALVLSGHFGLPVVRDGKIGPRRRSPVGYAAGGDGSDVEGMADMPAGRCFGDLFLRVAKGLWTTRWTPGASCTSTHLWGRDGHPGVTPERTPIPTLNGRASGRRAHYGPSHGLVGSGTQFACGIGPAGDGEAFHEAYSGLATAGLTLCRAPQVFRPGYGRHS